MPGLPLNRAGSPAARSATRPLVLRTRTSPERLTTAIPAESYPPVLQPGQPFQQDGHAVTAPDVSDDAAHALPPSAVDDAA